MNRYLDYFFSGRQHPVGLILQHNTRTHTHEHTSTPLSKALLSLLGGELCSDIPSLPCVRNSCLSNYVVLTDYGQLFDGRPLVHTLGTFLSRAGLLSNLLCRSLIINPPVVVFRDTACSLLVLAFVGSFVYYRDWLLARLQTGEPVLFEYFFKYLHIYIFFIYTYCRSFSVLFYIIAVICNFIRAIFTPGTP